MTFPYSGSTLPSMADLSAGQTSLDLLDQLDPEREYDRPFDEVVQAVRAGELILAPGSGNPLITVAGTGVFIKGTGRRLGSQEFKFNAAKIAALFATRIDDVDRWFFQTLEKTRDPRMFDIFYKRVGGNVGQNFGGMEPTEVVELMKAIASMSDDVPVKPAPIDVGMV